MIFSFTGGLYGMSVESSNTMKYCLFGTELYQYKAFVVNCVIPQVLLKQFIVFSDRNISDKHCIMIDVYLSGAGAPCTDMN